jgi:hypothetical protein
MDRPRTGLPRAPNSGSGGHVARSIGHGNNGTRHPRLRQRSSSRYDGDGDIGGRESGSSRIHRRRQGVIRSGRAREAADGRARAH